MELILFIRNWINDLISKYNEQKKRDEMYARLDRNGAGRFSQKEYIRKLNKTVKSERGKIKNKQDDAKRK